MLDHLYGETRPYFDEALRIIWSCDESVLDNLHRSKSLPDLAISSAAECAATQRKLPPLILIMAGASIVFR